MIYILDDTISQRKDDVLFLQDHPYVNLCVIVEKPTMKTNREIISKFLSGETNLLCIHKSLKYYNEDAKELNNSDAIRENLRHKVQESGVICVVFGRDMSRNESKYFIDKDLMYRNLRDFLDSYSKGIMEIGILYDGTAYNVVKRKRLLDEIISIVNDGYPPYENQELKKLIADYLPERSANDIIKMWDQKGFSKKEIRQFINDNL